ncbi:MAG: hypothetical protein ACREQV_00080 [Candidatus Binatia bacterium]
MSVQYIAEEVEQFILERIDSVAQLEALLLLRDTPNEAWNAKKLAKRLYITEEQTSVVLSGLLDQLLLTASEDEPPRYRYEPQSAELRQLVDRLAESYARHLVPVTNLIHSKPTTRVQEFADAFKLRKDK